MYLITLWYKYLLYKHQWNTRWDFAQNHDIVTCENNKLSVLDFEKKILGPTGPQVFILVARTSILVTKNYI